MIGQSKEQSLLVMLQTNGTGIFILVHNAGEQGQNKYTCIIEEYLKENSHRQTPTGKHSLQSKMSYSGDLIGVVLNLSIFSPSFKKKIN